MRQDNTSTLSDLASVATLQGLLTARRHEGCASGLTLHTRLSTIAQSLEQVEKSRFPRI
jgi:uncharacterized protein YicC (UPF0701 family)